MKQTSPVILSARRQLRTFFCSYSWPILLVFPLALWLMVFRGFFLDKVYLSADAVAYYEHFKFFLDQISRGIYPQWDPTNNWGIPIDLFMSRIGSYNPIFLGIVLLNKLGLAYTSAYLFFLGAYFVLGMLGFYWVCLAFLKDRRAAYLAYVLLMFSPFGPRIFDSYFHLTFVPLVWFFYFLITFTSNPDRFRALGMTFTAMIMMTTYVPFYFVGIFLGMLVSLIAIYFRFWPTWINRWAGFIKARKIFSVFCVFVFLLSVVPGIVLMKDGESQQISLPMRHINSDSKNVYEVHEKLAGRWGVLEEIVVSFFASDSKNPRMGEFYLPVFVLILFVLGMATTVNRRGALLVLWMLILLFVGSPQFLALHAFLSKHFFFYKYFRNLHYFLWLGAWPLFLVLLVEQFRQWMDFKPQDARVWGAALAWVVAAHAGLAVFCSSTGTFLLSGYLTLLLSGLFFIYLIFRSAPGSNFNGPNNSIMAMIFVALLAMAQPLEIFQGMIKDMAPSNRRLGYRYEHPYLNIALPSQVEVARLLKSQTELYGPDRQPREHPSVYLISRRVNDLFNKVDYDIFEEYASAKFVLYDQYELEEEDKIDIARVERSLDEFPNVALISGGNLESLPDKKSSEPTSLKARIIDRDFSDFEILDYDVNRVKLRIKLPSPKILVYNDAFDKRWKVFVNDRPSDLLRANWAFKGVWLPAGENVVEFCFGSFGKNAFHYFFLVLFWIVFVMLAVAGVSSVRHNSRETTPK